MVESIAPRRSREAGFSLIEILVVMLIVGILAGIALTLLLTQRGKGQDATAKHDARNVVGVVEACNATEGDYRSCSDPTALRDASVNFGSGAGQVEVDASAAREYTVTAHSRSGTDFVIARLASGAMGHTCSQTGKGGCDGTGHW
jgi:prepilin-type N-terminal cleavage/methylation domain-containing protein